VERILVCELGTDSATPTKTLTTRYLSYTDYAVTAVARGVGAGVAVGLTAGSCCGA
jgi:hypothetical protein